MTQCRSGDATIIEGLWAGRGKMLVCLHLHLLKYLETLQVHPCRSWEPLPFSEAKGQQVRPCRYEEEPQRAFQKELEPRVPPAPQGTLKGRPETCSVYHEPCWEAGVKGSPQLLSGIIPPQRLCFCVFRYGKENVLFHCVPNGPGTSWHKAHNGLSYPVPPSNRLDRKAQRCLERLFQKPTNGLIFPSQLLHKCLLLSVRWLKERRRKEKEQRREKNEGLYPLNYRSDD